MPLSGGKDSEWKEEIGGMLEAYQLVKNPEKINEIKGQDVIIYEYSLTHLMYHNVNKAINFMSQRGWKCVNICAAEKMMCALMQKQ